MERGDFIVSVILGGFLVLTLGLLLTSPMQNTVLHTRNIPKTYYENTEEWEILKNEKGRTTGVRVKRIAKQS